MRNIKLTIEYDGTDYSGWQIQKSPGRGQKKTIQETLQRALAQIVQEPVRIIASGRTDAGVHARGQVANFQSKTKLSCNQLQKGLNAVLPWDIRIKQVQEAALPFHARFAARSKLYRYTIINDSFISPFLQRFCYLVKYPLDIRKMRQGAQFFLGKKDFRSFQAVDKKQTPAVRTIRRLDIRKKGAQINVEIEADGFVYRMVRNIVGTLIEVGRGKLTPQSIRQIMRAKKRICAGPSAPAKGLCLVEVKYKESSEKV